MSKRVHMRVSLVVAVSALLLIPASGAAVSFGPGLWEGKGRLTGGFHGKGFSARIIGAGGFSFCLDKTSEGLVPEHSRWVIDPTALRAHYSSRVLSGTAHGKFDGEGTFHSPGVVEIFGEEHLEVTVKVVRFAIHETFSFPIRAELPVHRATPNRVSADIAVENRSAQRQSGFTSTERGTFVAQRVKSCAVVGPPKLS